MTIGQLAKQHGLSRSTLLYYHRLGLLKPSGRLRNGYRHYTTRDDARLRRICLYRRTGLPLAKIGPLLIRPGRQALALILESQLHELSTQIEALRGRQRLVVELLQDHRLLERLSIRDRDAWVRLLRGSGFAGQDLVRWHRDFERLAPHYHQRFLEHLQIPGERIAAIRRRAQQVRG